MFGWMFIGCAEVGWGATWGDGRPSYQYQKPCRRQGLGRRFYGIAINKYGTIKSNLKPNRAPAKHVLFGYSFAAEAFVSIR